MLKLPLRGESEKLRTECREWLKKNPPPQSGEDLSLEKFQEIGRAWQKKLAEAKLLAVHWQKEFGGRGLTLAEEAIIQEELVVAGAPQILGLFGITMVGPVLIEHGTPEQKKRFLNKILLAEEIWCQGFSEPEAGSDLANLKAHARPVDGGFELSGQKVWTSFAHVADWCFVLCRTSQEPQKHKGLSYLLVNMKSPGITVRPLTQISGDAEFNEVFFDKVFVPQEMVVGAVGEGWKIALSTLMYERVVLTFVRQIQSETLLKKMIARSGAASSHARVLADHIATACAVRALSYQHLLEYASGTKPGPEGSMNKLLWSESFQEICKTLSELEREHFLSGNSEAAHQYLYSRGRTIAAGTSEIQRNIIAERVLGMRVPPQRVK